MCGFVGVTVVGATMDIQGSIGERWWFYGLFDSLGLCEATKKGDWNGEWDHE